MAIILVLTLSTALFISSKGNRVLVTLAAVEAGAGPLQIGIMFALHGIFPFLLATYAGRIADRFSNRLLVYAGIAGFAIALALPYLWPGLASLYVSSALGGFTSMLFVLAFQNLMGILSTPQTRTRLFSWYALGESFAHGLGPILTGLCIDHYNATVTFLLVSLFTAIWLPVAYAFRRYFPEVKRAPPGAAGAARSSRDLLALPAMRMALITNGVVMIGFDLFNLYMPVYGKSLNFSATTIGLIIGAYGLAATITRVILPFASARLGERRILVLALAIPACGFALIPLTGNFWLLAPLAFFIGFGLGCGQPLSMVLAFNAAPEGRSAEAIAMRLAVSYGAHVVLPPLFGAFGAVLGLAPVFWICAMLLGGGASLHRNKT
jgi:MFS family permease